MPVPRRTFRSEGGYLLAETLVGMAILTVALIAMLDLGAFIRGVSPAQRKLALNLASGKVEQLADQYYHSNIPLTPSGRAQTVTLGQYSFSVDYALQNYSPTLNDYPQELTQLQQVMVTVQCTNCGRLSPEVKVVALLVQAG